VCILHEEQSGTDGCVWVEIHSVVIKASLLSVPTVGLNAYGYFFILNMCKISVGYSYDYLYL
jgi:hypothetical protein